MRLAFVTLALLLVATPVQAESCQEKFVRLYTARNAKVPTRITVTQEVKGQKPTRNYNYSDGTGDWMSEAIEPANMPWSMVRGQAMYASYDRGKTWKKIRMLDSGHDPEAVARQLQAAAATVRNATCGKEDIGGVMHETIAADYDQPAYKTSHRDTYWVDPATGWISKSTGLTKQAGFESFVTQIVERVPDLKLPTPK